MIGPLARRAILGTLGLAVIAAIWSLALDLDRADIGVLVAAYRRGGLLLQVSLGAAAVGALGGLLGSFAVLRGHSLLGDVASHSALPGIYIAFSIWIWLGIETYSAFGIQMPPARSLGVVSIGALTTASVAAILVIAIGRLSRLDEDAALAITLSVFFGGGLVLRSILQRGNTRRAGLESFLFGSTATISMDEIAIIASLGLIALLAVLALWKEFSLLIFDPDYLGSLGFSARALDLVLTGTIVVAVVAGLQMVGVVLMSSLLIAPPVAARQWTERFAPMVVLSVAIGMVSSSGGVAASYIRDGIATGPVIALLATSIAFYSLICAPGRGWLWTRIVQIRRDRRFIADTLLLHVHAEGMPHSPTRLRRQLAWPRPSFALALRRAIVSGMLVRDDSGLIHLTSQGRLRCDLILTSLGDRPENHQDSLP
jgi:manganese/zinc/iron transport system permease protein